MDDKDTKSSEWTGKRVKQVTSDLGYEAHVGRTGTVDQVFEDEKGAVHCRTSDGMWCPARHLAVVD